MITILTNAIVTAYIATGNPCANGHYPTAGITVALPRYFPLESKVIIDGHEYIGEDRMNLRFPDRFDIFFQSKKDALLWGKQHKSVTVKIPNTK